MQRLALLHVYVHMHKVNLAKVVSILRPLDQIEVAVSVLPSLHSVQVMSPTSRHELLYQSGSEDVLESSEALSVFIISALFNAISGIGMSCSSSMGTREEQEIKVWFQTYRDVVSSGEGMRGCYNLVTTLQPCNNTQCCVWAIYSLTEPAVACNRTRNNRTRNYSIQNDA